VLWIDGIGLAYEIFGDAEFVLQDVEGFKRAACEHPTKIPKNGGCCSGIG